MTLDSQLGSGSVFTLTVKAQATSADKISIEHLNSVNGSSKRVLVVEDDDDLVELINIYLNEYGYETLNVENGEDAIQKCVYENIDLMLLDMQLPKLSGIDVARNLRKTYSDMPIIGMTASSNNEDKIKALKAGCNEFLVKPIQPASLANAIYNILN